MDNSDKFSSSKDVIAFLAQSFPACFSIEGNAKPLKIGIFQDLAAQLEDEPRVSKTLLRSALRHYTNSWRYLHAIKEGEARVDLQGQPGELIDKQHAEHAATQLAESKQRVAEQRKAQQKERPAKPAAKTRKVPSAKTSKRDSKSTGPRPVPAKLTDETMVSGTKVTVKIGKAPMPATITDVAKDGVHIQLASGMSMKVQPHTLRLANESKSKA